MAERILAEQAALEARGAPDGERKTITALFADIKGSMALLEDLDPEEARRIIDPALTLMMEAVHRYEGNVAQSLGDGIFALFGAPIAHEDHAQRALYAALRMQDNLRHYADRLRLAQGLTLQIRVGLNTGEVVVRSIHTDDLHTDYVPIGHATSLAARMQSLAHPGSIVVSEPTFRLTDGHFAFHALGAAQIKGVREPVPIYEVAGVGPLRTRLQVVARRGLAQFVGRQRELELLQRAWEQAQRGQGQIVAAMGEPGVGKSRLCYEFKLHCQRHGLVLETFSVSHSRASPYLPLIELLTHYFVLTPQDDDRRRREQVTGKVLTLDRSLEDMLPYLSALVGVTEATTELAHVDPQLRRQRTFEAITRLLLRESLNQPVLLLLEDLHWLDSETQAWLTLFSARVATARLLLLVNYRPEYQHGWGSKTSYTQLRLDPLLPASANELLQGLLGDDASLAPLTQLLIARTQGNPFFLEESVRTLVETQVLVGEQGAYHLAQALPGIQVPATVQAVLAARIDRLPLEEKQLLQIAAVIGTEVSLPLLQAMAEVPEETLHRSLAHLQAAEFLYETRLFPECEYTCKHALTHEVAYGSLLQERRRVVHGRIVEALEGLTGDRLAEQVERLAYHALRGEVWDKALGYFRQAGEKARARSAYREAVGYFEQALSALMHLPETRDTCVQAIDLRLALRSALQPLGDFGRLLVVLREAETLAEALDDTRRLARVSGFLSIYFRYMGAYDDAISAARRVLGLAAVSGEVVLHALANHYLGCAYLAQGDYYRALDCLRHTVASLDGARRHERFGQASLPAVNSRAHLAWCHAELGTFAEGRVFMDEGLQIAEAVAYPGDLIPALWGLGLLSLRQGNLPRAIALLERAMNICQEIDSPTLFPRVAVALGTAYTLAGHVADAVPLLTQATKQAIVTEQALCCLSLGEAQLLAGRLEEAQACAEQAQALAREHQERSNQVYALRLLGEVAAHRDPPKNEQAEPYYRQALALADELGMRPLQAHCHRGLGALYAKTGQYEQARTELGAAIDLYRAMDMTFWLPQTEAVWTQVVE